MKEVRLHVLGVDDRVDGVPIGLGLRAGALAAAAEGGIASPLVRRHFELAVPAVPAYDACGVGSLVEKGARAALPASLLSELVNVDKVVVVLLSVCLDQA